jgi:hypothetical protein
MVLSGSDILITVLFIISGSITFAVLSNFIYKKSFHQIYDELSKPNQTDEKKMQIIDRLYAYIREYSDEQILIFNFRFNRFKLNHCYSVIFITIQIIFILAMIKFELSSSIKALIVFLICSGYLFPIVFIWMRFGKIGFDRASIQNIVGVFLFIFLRVVNVLAIILACILLLLAMLNQFVKLKPNTSFFDVFAPYLNYGGLESISSNQFSLAGLFFTFAIGGTIIFSVTSRYLTQKKKIGDMLLKDAKKYEKWFENNKYNVSFNFHDIIKVDSGKIKGYNQALFNLRSELNIDGYIKSIHPVKRYEFFCFLVFGMYVLGISTLLLNQSFINLLFIIFILFSFLFMLLIYYIFRDYS